MSEPKSIEELTKEFERLMAEEIQKSEFYRNSPAPPSIDMESLYKKFEQVGLSNSNEVKNLSREISQSPHFKLALDYYVSQIAQIMLLLKLTEDIDKSYSELQHIVSNAFAIGYTAGQLKDK